MADLARYLWEEPQFGDFAGVAVKWLFRYGRGPAAAMRGR